VCRATPEHFVGPSVPPATLTTPLHGPSLLAPNRVCHTEGSPATVAAIGHWALSICALPVTKSGPKHAFSTGISTRTARNPHRARSLTLSIRGELMYRVLCELMYLLAIHASPLQHKKATTFWSRQSYLLTLVVEGKTSSAYGNALGTVTDVTPEQPPKALMPRVASCCPLSPRAPAPLIMLGRCTAKRRPPSGRYSYLVTEVVEAKALLTSVAALGTATDVKPEQPLKADSPMLVTEGGMVTDVKPLQPAKAA